MQFDVFAVLFGMAGGLRDRTNEFSIDIAVRFHCCPYFGVKFGNTF